MVKAGALYFAIVIAFFIAIISASLIMLAAHYRNAYLKEMRLIRLNNNLAASIQYALATDENRTLVTIDLYGNKADSVIIERKQWGLYDFAVIKTFILQDTLKKSILIGVIPDSTVLYLSDEDRPLAVSGATKIIGNAQLPKAGIKKSYAEGKPYANDKMIYEGSTSLSSNSLRPLNQFFLNSIIDKLVFNGNHLPPLKMSKVKVSFLDSTQSFSLLPKANLSNVSLDGNIILFADSSITIGASAMLKDVQVYAPFIKVEDGFVGNCQLFATDSIQIGNNVKLNYPTVAAVIRTEKSAPLPMISVGSDVIFSGILFSYEKKRTPLQSIVSLGKKTTVKGEVFCAGVLKLQKGATVAGKVSCNGFLMETSTNIYENLLIDVNFNNKARSKYYLSAKLFDSKNDNKVLKWLY